MARKLHLEEELLFNEALNTSDTEFGEVNEDWFHRHVATRRDTALALSPEMQALLESKFPERVPQ